MKLSSAPFCQDFPGSLSAVSIFALPSHSRIAWLTNSGLVVRAQESRRAALGDQACKHLNHAAGTNEAGDVDRQALAGELIDHRQAFDLLAARAGVEREVEGSDVVGTERGHGPRA